MLSEFHDEVHALKTSNHHFARLYDEVTHIDKEIHRIEVEAEVTTEEFLEELKKKRLLLKDELLGMIQEYRASQS